MKSLGVFLISILLPLNLLGQGCSDAGFCTIGSMDSHANDTKSQSLTFGIYSGSADNDASLLLPTLEYRNTFNEKWSIHAKMNASFSDGNLGSISGLGDAFIAGTYALYKKEKNTLAATLGTKIPLSSADKTDNGIILPLDYQPSFGSFDIIAGISYQISHLNLSFAYQQPLTESKDTYLGNYTRAPDVLLKATYQWKIDKFTLIPNTQFIYRVSEDEVEQLGVSQSIDGSDGLTWNIALNTEYAFNSKHNIGLLLASPLVVRDTRSDGLTRSFLGGLYYVFQF